MTHNYAGMFFFLRSLWSNSSSVATLWNSRRPLGEADAATKPMERSLLPPLTHADVVAVSRSNAKQTNQKNCGAVDSKSKPLEQLLTGTCRRSRVNTTNGSRQHPLPFTAASTAITTTAATVATQLNGTAEDVPPNSSRFSCCFSMINQSFYKCSFCKGLLYSGIFYTMFKERYFNCFCQRNRLNSLSVS